MSNRNRNKASEKGKKSEKKIATKQAQKLLEKQRAVRVAAVEDGIQKLLKKHNCAIDLQMTFSANRGMLGGSLVVIPLADQPTE